MTFAVWYKSELNPFLYRVTEVLSRYLEMAAVDPDAPGAFRFAEPGKLARILNNAGVVDITQRIFKFQIKAPISFEEFWTLRSETSEILREKLKSLTEEQSLRVAKEVQDSVRPFFSNNGMSFPSEMIIASGRKAK